MVDGWVISCENAVRWMSLDLTDDKSTLVQVMAWCRQATSHYLSQCWPRSMSPNGVTRPQWVKFTPCSGSWWWWTRPTSWTSVRRTCASCRRTSGRIWRLPGEARKHTLAGGWFNIKMPSYQYSDSHYKDEMIVKLSDLYNGNSYTGKLHFYIK